MKVDEEFMQPESIRNLPRVLPKRETLRRFQNSETVVNKKYNSRLVLNTSADSELSRANREYSSVQSMIDENKKYLQEEMKQLVNWDEENYKKFCEVDIRKGRSNLEEGKLQNQMIELRDQFSGSSLYNEEELTREMDDLKNQVKDVISVDIAEEKLRFIGVNNGEQSIDNISDIQKREEYVVSLNEEKKKKLL